MMRPFWWRARAALLPAAVVAVLVVAIASPLALNAAGTAFDLNWVLLGNIGQAYGAAAAVLSALALAGVAASIRYQVRAIHQQRILASQDKLYDMLRMIIDDPHTYAPAWGNRWDGMTVQELKRDIFSQMAITHVAFGYLTGVFSKDELEGPDGLEYGFNLPGRRKYWIDFRDAWLDPRSNPDRHRFGVIADAIYQNACAKNPEPPEPLGPVRTPEERESAPKTIHSRAIAAGVVGLSLGIALSWLAAARRPDRR